MARWIKADGTQQEIHPSHGPIFTLQEMNAFVGGYLEAIGLDGQLTMYCNEDAIRLELPPNPAAIKMLRLYGVPIFAGVYGDVLVASLAETGDEQGLTNETRWVDLPCEECKRPGPTVQWLILEMSGVLCLDCLRTVLGSILKELSHPPSKEPIVKPVEAEQMDSRMPNLYQSGGGPLRWQDDQTGVLPEAVMAYLQGRAAAEEIELVRDYYQYYIHAPCWQIGDGDFAKQFTALRERIKKKPMTEPELYEWTRDALHVGIDPL